jgi:hypothetical protein
MKAAKGDRVSGEKWLPLVGIYTKVVGRLLDIDTAGRKATILREMAPIGSKVEEIVSLKSVRKLGPPKPKPPKEVFINFYGGGTPLAPRFSEVEAQTSALPGVVHIAVRYKRA